MRKIIACIGGAVAALAISLMGCGTASAQSASYQQGYNDAAVWVRVNYVPQPGPQHGLPSVTVDGWCQMFYQQLANGGRLPDRQMSSSPPDNAPDYLHGCHDGFGLLRHN
jgi:hypothetical protein